MIIAPLPAIHIALAAASAGLALTASESVWHWAKGQYEDRGVWPWRILKEAYSPTTANMLEPLMKSEGVLFLNPGSAGPRRFTLPVSIARLRVDDGRLEPEIVELDVASTARG